jgi:hypothetical protein
MLTRLRLLLVVLAASVIFASCTVQQSTDQNQSFEMGFVAFGDSGYYYDYLKPSQINEVYTTKEAYLASQKADWLDDKKLPEEFLPVPPYYLSSIGGYLEASGLFPVAQSMKTYCQSSDCQFSVMLGDNIYPDGATLGADGKDDATRFDTLFTKPYGDLGEGNPDYKVYVALGNHDWRTSRAGAMAQVEFMESTAPFYMDGLFYSVKPPAANDEVELFVIDTEIILASTTVYEAELNDDGSEMPTTEVDEPLSWAKPQNEAEKNMVAWLDEAMKNSDARWKFVIGHHPIWSTGGSKFEQAKALRRLIMPSLCRYADAYFAGHEHSLELHEDSCESVFGKGNKRPVLEIISGAAGKQRGVNTPFLQYQERTNPDNKTIWAKGMVWGFSHIQLNDDDAQVDMIVTPNSGTGESDVIYSYKFKRRSHIANNK